MMISEQSDDFLVNMNTMTTSVVVWAQIEAEVYFHAENIYLLWHIYCPAPAINHRLCGPTGNKWYWRPSGEGGGRGLKDGGLRNDHFWYQGNMNKHPTNMSSIVEHNL